MKGPPGKKNAIIFPKCFSARERRRSLPVRRAEDFSGGGEKTCAVAKSVTGRNTPGVTSFRKKKDACYTKKHMIVVKGGFYTSGEDTARLKKTVYFITKTLLTKEKNILTREGRHHRNASISYALGIFRLEVFRAEHR